MDINTLPSYQEAVEQLDSFANLERAPAASGNYQAGPERMARLMKRLGSPHAGIPAIHVAGTKGKGSTTHLAAAALGAAGIRCGLYTSPHVETLRERISVHGRPIGEQRFAEAAAPALREAEAMRSEGDAPSYFEVLTAIALVAFKESKVEAMILETGLGGRLDATNLPDLRCAAVGITAISKDHEALLGDSLAKIAAEKLEIIRPGVPVVAMPQEEGVMDLIVKKAAERRSRLFVVGKEIAASFRKRPTPDKPGLGQRLDLETWRNVYPDIALGLLGEHQAMNAGLALGLVDLFLEYMDREPLDSMVLKRAWRGLTLPARMEVIEMSPWHIVDAAHNPASAWAAAETLREAFTTANRALIFGVASDKDYRVMLRVFAPFFRHIVFTGFDSPRAVEPETLAAFAAKEFPDVKVSVALDAAHALELARGFVGRDGLILTTGSFYLAGEMRALCRRETATRL